jgi:SRSO17 transposase
LIVDGMGIPKQGDYSVGVYQQWCGATGKLDNCQVTVNCTLARPDEDRNADQVTWPLGMRLYLPKKWTGEDESFDDDQHERADYVRRREAAAIPDAIGYKPKYEIAIDQIEAAIQTDLDHACVIANTNYGMRSTFRKQLRELGESYVLESETGRRSFSRTPSCSNPGTPPGPERPANTRLFRMMSRRKRRST